MIRFDFAVIDPWETYFRHHENSCYHDIVNRIRIFSPYSNSYIMSIHTSHFWEGFE